MKFLLTKSLLFVGVLSTLALTLPRFTSANEKADDVEIVDLFDEVLDRNGKKELAADLAVTYTKSSWKHRSLDKLISENTSEAFEHQKDLFNFRSKKPIYAVDNLNIRRDDLMKTVHLLNSAPENPEARPEDLFELHQIKGRDDKGSVHFTGYYTPVLKVSRKRTGIYEFPLYAVPKNIEGNWPSRAEIDGKGVLKNQGLEIAYASNPIDVYFMQVQGSGYIEFPDGTQSLLSYAGSNKKSYRSIGRYLISKGYTTKDKVSINSIKKFIHENPDKKNEVLFANPSYVFFEEGQGVVKGTGITPLTAGHSIAVDPKYIPLGSTLLAKVPIADDHGKFLYHEYRLLFAQDTGGAINGAGHVDLYAGIGGSAKRIACNTHHYGELWLILPKQLDTSP